MPIQAATAGFEIAMVAMSVGLATAFVAAVAHADPSSTRRAVLVVTGWLALTAGLARLGALRFDTMPPTMFVLVAALTVCALLFARGELGGRLAVVVPLVALVGFQAFRIPIELWIHRGYELGVFPEHMTYSGLNFDVVSGLSALVVAFLLHRGVVGRRVVLAWNVVALGLLLTIVAISILSAPVPFRLFLTEPGSAYVQGFPGVWLPAVAVQAALMGHLLVFRRLLGSPRPSRGG